VWAIKADGTFQVALNNSNRVNVWGKYTVAGDTMTIQESHGSKNAEGLQRSSHLQIQPQRRRVALHLVSDTCKLREKNVLLPWKPWKGK